MRKIHLRKPALCCAPTIALILAPVLACVLPQAAHAQRPAFQAPFPCGQIWRASTYEGHGSDAIDLVQRNAAQAIIGEDLPTLASAAGTVALDYTWPAGSDEFSKEGERWVAIDHGDGWRTHYFHLADEPGQPRLTVGRRVAMGEVLGRTSNSGTPAIHLHYAQMKDVARDAERLNLDASQSADNWRRVLRDGTKIRIRFNETQIDTYLANRDSWSTFGSDSAEKIRSLNCLQGRFVQWYSGGDTYMLRYSPGGWDIRVNRIDPTGGDNPSTLAQNLGANWTNMMPFYSATNGQPHLLTYNFATGEARFRRISPGNDAMTFLNSVPKYAGWTDIQPHSIGGKPHALFYDSRYGWFNVDEITVTSDNFISRLKTKIRTGFTAMVPYTEGPRRYVLMYRASDGRMEVHRLIRASNGAITRERTWSATRATGWTHMNLLSHRGQRLILGYDAVTGEARIWKIDGNGDGLTGVARMDWPKGLTALTPYLNDGRAHVLAYRMSDGLSRKYRLRDDLQSFRTFTTEYWAIGYN